MYTHRTHTSFSLHHRCKVLMSFLVNLLHIKRNVKLMTSHLWHHISCNFFHTLYPLKLRYVLKIILLFTVNTPALCLTSKCWKMLFNIQTKCENLIRRKYINVSQNEGIELCETRNYDCNITLVEWVQGVNFPFWWKQQIQCNIFIQVTFWQWLYSSYSMTFTLILFLHI